MPVYGRLNGAQGWSVASMPPPGGAVEAGLEGVSCVSSSECMAVGLSVNAAGAELPYGALWSKGAWHVQALVPPDRERRPRGRLLSICEILCRCRFLRRRERGQSCPDRDLERRRLVDQPGAGSTSGRERLAERSVLCLIQRLHGGWHVHGRQGRRGSCRALGWDQMVSAGEREHGLPGRTHRRLVSRRRRMHGGRKLRAGGALGGDGPSVERVSWSAQASNVDQAQASELHAVSCVASSTCAAVGVTGWSGAGRSHSGLVDPLVEIRSAPPFPKAANPPAPNPPGAAPGSPLLTGSARAALAKGAALESRVAALRCRVPLLRGVSEKLARRRLSRAHCALGRVSASLPLHREAPRPQTGPQPRSQPCGKHQDQPRTRRRPARPGEAGLTSRSKEPRCPFRPFCMTRPTLSPRSR